MVFNAVGVHRRGQLSMDTFRTIINSRTENQQCFQTDKPRLNFPDRLPTLDECAHLLVAEALRRANQNQSVAAGLLGISRPAVNKRQKNPS
jgi:hypothetical protein